MTKLPLPGDILRAKEAIEMIPQVDLGPPIEVPPIPRFDYKTVKYFNSTLTMRIIK